MNLMISPLSQTPIYAQLEAQLRQNILSGELSANEALPSIRALAKELGIGIITVKRAYDDLCSEGLLVSLQGRGVFVAPMDSERARQIRMAQLAEKLRDIRQYCDSSAITREELIDAIQKIYEEEFL
ncbi:MAG: GntR family transcriptional regulator [Clostridiales bacterium]|nr:GntR family transcriptional regulator [Candidatus Cacconaster stercorequi]